jgi:hypothetical protein
MHINVLVDFNQSFDIGKEALYRNHVPTVYGMQQRKGKEDCQASHARYKSDWCKQLWKQECGK